MTPEDLELNIEYLIEGIDRFCSDTQIADIIDHVSQEAELEGVKLTHELRRRTEY